MNKTGISTVIKGIKYLVREYRHLFLFILFLFSSDYRLSFLKIFLPENILAYSISIGVLVYLNILAVVIMLDIPFFEQINIKPKILFWANGFLLIMLIIMNGMIYLAGLLPETNTNPFWIIYAILAGVILLGIVIGFIKRSEQLSK
jgi:hypothetical protein